LSVARLPNILENAIDKLVLTYVGLKCRHDDRFVSRRSNSAHVFDVIDTTSVIRNTPPDCSRTLLERRPGVDARPREGMWAWKLVSEISRRRRITRVQNMTDKAPNTMPLSCREYSNRIHIHVPGRRVGYDGSKDSLSTDVHMPIQLHQSANSQNGDQMFQDRLQPAQYQPCALSKHQNSAADGGS
jgi:hypothetical protein